MRKATAVLVAAAMAMGAAWGQQVSTLIETTGEATIYTAPTHADFWIHLVAAEEDFRSGVSAAEQFERALREALASKSITPTDTDVQAPAIATVNQPLVDISAKLQFNMGPYKNKDNGPQQFAALCDNLKEIAGNVGTSIEGPILYVENDRTAVRSAVAKATENAYPPAEAIAQELNSNVYAVASVNVEELRWNDAEEVRAAEPNLRQVSLTAVVRVAYEVVSRN
ncbi:MAG: SIMPL domain-containing protein [Candidatus Hydrogenedentota bacterium]